MTGDRLDFEYAMQLSVAVKVLPTHAPQNTTTTLRDSEQSSAEITNVQLFRSRKHAKKFTVPNSVSATLWLLSQSDVYSQCMTATGGWRMQEHNRYNSPTSTVTGHARIVTLTGHASHDTTLTGHARRDVTLAGASSIMVAHLLVGAGTTLSNTSARAESALPPVVITAAATVMPWPSDTDRAAEVTSVMPPLEAATAGASVSHEISGAT